MASSDDYARQINSASIWSALLRENILAGLVEEIQKDTLNSNISVTVILRKVKAAASKLNLGKVEDWVEHELNGYGNVDVPSYRRLRGRPQALNPYQGWIPIILSSDELNELLSSVVLRQSLPSIEDLIEKSQAGFAEMPLPPGVIRSLNRGADVEFGRMSVHLSTTQLQGVVDAVRNAALDWALALEKAGIAGEGFSFDNEEKSRAQSPSTTYNINAIGSFTGVMGSGNTTETITSKKNDLTQISSIISQIRDSMPELVSAGAHQPQLESALQYLESECASNSPSKSKLRAFLSDAKQALLGAAGNLTAEGALSLIAIASKAVG